MKNVEDLYELSPMQQGMLFHTLQAPASERVYLIQIGCSLRGKLDVSAFTRAWQRVVDRQPVLRTSFHWADVDKPLQVVHRDVALRLPQQDWQSMTPAEQQSRLPAFEAEQWRGFELDEHPLMRLALVRLGNCEHRFLWTFHHIILEGWSASLILDEVFAFYKAFSRGEEIAPEASRPYRDYILWLQQQDPAKAEAYWRGALKGFSEPTALAVDRAAPSPATGPTVYAEERAALSESTSEALRSLARQHRLTMNTVVQGAWSLLLSRYSGQEDVLFGTVVSGRPASLLGSQSMIGLFINTLAARVRVAPQEGVVPWLQRLQEQQVRMRELEHCSLIDVQGWSEVPRGRPFFESILIFENWLGDISFRGWAEELEIHDLSCREGGTGYPLTVSALPGPELSLTATFDTLRFESATVARLLNHLAALLEAMAADPVPSISELSLLTPVELCELEAWNTTSRAYARDACLADLFEAQVDRRPNQVAAVFEDEQLSYRELNERANQLAQELRGLGVGPEVLVGIYMERSLEMLVALLGVLKAGGAYVPLDPAYPRKRVSFMLEDSGAAILLTQRALLGALPEHVARVVCVDEAGPARPGVVLNPSRATTAENLAYVIYTSGSTGRPKGVQVTQRALVNFLSSMGREPGLSGGDTLLSVTTLSFDIVGLELYLPLVLGGRVVLVSREEAADGVKLLARLHVSGATVMQATPATWRLLLEVGWSGDAGLKILCGGESLTRPLADQLLERGSSLWNLYGPTETTIWSTLWEVEGGGGPVTIGRPIANTRIYVLDARGRRIPVGVAGELCIGGEGLARGYLNRPELTAEKFIPDAFSPEPGARLYRTGDLARYLPDGRIEWLGRGDHQVKLRGYRIELGEIERALASHVAVAGAVVLAQPGPAEDKRLIAYLMPATGQEPTVTELRNHLRSLLPIHMIPASFVVLDRFPLTPNGKVDRSALANIERENDPQAHADQSPRTPMERLLADIWREVLGVERIGVRDNFFDLGGHSLLALRVISRLQKQTGQRINPRDIIFQTLEQLAAMCEPRSRAAAETSAGGLTNGVFDAAKVTLDGQPQS